MGSSPPALHRTVEATSAFSTHAPSKHLGVLRAVELVLVRVDGRHRWYRVNGHALKPIHDWVRAFERTWNVRLDQLDDLLVELQSEEHSP